MCGRFNNHLKAMRNWADLLREWPGDARLRYNVAPTATIPIVIDDKVVSARWGLIPSWSKEFKSKYSTFNARVESANEKPLFRGAWKNSHTCLVPAAGYYEWRLEDGVKQPYYIHTPEAPLMFAGLWEPWEDRYSCTILTEDSKGSMKNLHHRMPVMLDYDDSLRWLEKGTTETFMPNVYERLNYYPVSTAVNSSRSEGEDLIVNIQRS